MLFLVATPIGNLKDISLRALEILQECDYILCEDTRHSIRLLNHYQIKKPLKSYHKFNEQKALEAVLEDLRQGLNIALISDAGTPGISDPGTLLVQRAKEEQLLVSSIPGPCALIAALTSSGLATDRFQFMGFLPKKYESLKKALQEALMYCGTSISYLPARDIPEVLQVLLEIAPQRIVCIARELTKQFEESVKGTSQQLLEHFKEAKGEAILLIAQDTNEKVDWSTLSEEEHVSFMEHTYQMSKKEAIKAVAELRGSKTHYLQ